jgi:hypothetical protein
LRDCFLSSACAGCLCLVERLIPNAGRRLLASQNFAIDPHCVVGLLLHGQPSGFVKAAALFGRKDTQLFHCAYLRIIGIDLAKAIQVRTLVIGFAIFFGSARQAGKGLSLVGIDQQNFLPVLRSQVNSSP